MRLAIDKPKRRVSNFWTIYDQLKRGVIKLDAPYQRDIVWSKNKMSMLIDSAMNNYYIPPLIFSVRPTPEGNVRYCIDGKQRLSSIWKFMRNEIPYVEESDEKEEELYFDPTGTQDVLEGVDRTYLTDLERERFNDLEFTMIEYNNLSEDEELEIFSRVQMGVSLTTGEKLYAYNSPVATFCKDLAKTYDLKNAIPKSNRGESLRAISNLVYLLYENHQNNDTVLTSFMATPVNLHKFLKNHNIDLSNEFKESVITILTVYEKIAADSQGFQVLNQGNTNRKQKLPMILFLIFGIYINTHQRSLKQYINDLYKFRSYVENNYKTTAAFGNPAYRMGLKWIESMNEKNEDHNYNNNVSNLISFSTLPTTIASTSSSLSPSVADPASNNQNNHHNYNDIRDDMGITNKNKTNNINKINNTNKANTKTKGKNRNGTDISITVSSDEAQDEYSDDDSEDDQIMDYSDDSTDYGNKLKDKTSGSTKLTTTTTISDSKSFTTNDTILKPSPKRLKTAHNNKTALNQQLKINESKPSNKSYTGQTNRSGQPMARRGGHRK